MSIAQDSRGLSADFAVFGFQQSDDGGKVFCSRSSSTNLNQTPDRVKSRQLVVITNDDSSEDLYRCVFAFRQRKLRTQANSHIVMMEQRRQFFRRSMTEACLKQRVSFGNHRFAESSLVEDRIDASAGCVSLPRAGWIVGNIHLSVVAEFDIAGLNRLAEIVMIRNRESRSLAA